MENEIIVDVASAEVLADSRLELAKHRDGFRAHLEAQPVLYQRRVQAVTRQITQLPTGHLPLHLFG